MKIASQHQFTQHSLLQDRKFVTYVESNVPTRMYLPIHMNNLTYLEIRLLCTCMLLSLHLMGSLGVRIIQLRY